jgi:hypothetical protein
LTLSSLAVITCSTQLHSTAGSVNVLLVAHSIMHHEPRLYCLPAGFLSDVLMELGPGPFLPWAYTLSLDTVSAATLNPRLAGLYRLLATAVKLSQAAGLVAPSAQQHHSQQSLGSGSSSSGSSSARRPDDEAALAAASSGGVAQDRAQLMRLLKNFLPSVVASCRSLTGDVLCASLTLLLAAPSVLLPTHLMVTPLRLALMVGLQQPAVAAVAVDALEAWEQQQQQQQLGHEQQLEELLPVIVPLLNPYLQDLSGSSATEEYVSEDEDEEEDEVHGEAAAGAAGREQPAASTQQQQQQQYRQEDESSSDVFALEDRRRSYLRREKREAGAVRKAKEEARQVGVLMTL